MRVFITVLVLIFSLQSLTKADDIRDLEIEGMSIGDSLLDFMSENQIKDSLKSKFAVFYEDKFATVSGWDIKDKEIVDLAHIPEWARKIFSVDKKLSWDKTLIFNSHQLHVSGKYKSDRVAITIWLKHL